MQGRWESFFNIDYIPYQGAKEATSDEVADAGEADESGGGRPEQEASAELSLPTMDHFGFAQSTTSWEMHPRRDMLYESSMRNSSWQALRHHLRLK